MKEAKENAVDALLAAASDEVRVYRDGRFPAVGKSAARTLLKPGQVSFEPMGGGASYAEDIAYSYGKYSLTLKEGGESGYYLHIWQTDKNNGLWKLGATVAKRKVSAVKSATSWSAAALCRS
jgi:hypothetical protein